MAYIFGVSSTFGNYGSQLFMFDTASNDVTIVYL